MTESYIIHPLIHKNVGWKCEGVSDQKLFFYACHRPVQTHMGCYHRRYLRIKLLVKAFEELLHMGHKHRVNLLGRKLPVLVLNTGEPLDYKDLWEHIDTCYHMEVVDDFEYLLTAESKRLKAKEEATVTVNSTKKWIHSMKSKRVYSMNGKA